MILDMKGSPIGSNTEPQKQVEIVRSFSFKLNLGNYQSADFFASQKAQVDVDNLDSASADLYEWCYEQVMESVKDVQRKQAEKAAKAARSAA